MFPKSAIGAVAVSEVTGSIFSRACQLAFLVALVAAPAFAKTHIPLEKNVDSTKCLECHNSDDDREFGGTGPSGPHGSIYPHIFERRYEMSQVAPGVFPAGGPGSPILSSTLFPGPLTSAGGAAPGPWALCGKCHSLSNIFGNNTFQYHSLHVSTVGISCSVCHTGHGMGATSPNITGERLVNFDTNVVAPNAINSSGTLGISYNRSTNTCALVCHMYSHNYDGTVTQANTAASQTKMKPGGISVRH